MGRVLGFGAVTIDDLIYVDRPLSAGKGKVTRRIGDHGGNVATALVAVARLGGHAGFIGWLGDGSLDDPGAGELAREGVDVSRAPRRADARSIRSVITVAPDGERFIAYDDEVPHGTDAALPDATLAGGGCCSSTATRRPRAGWSSGRGRSGSRWWRTSSGRRGGDGPADGAGRPPGAADRLRARLGRREPPGGDARRAPLVGGPGGGGADRRRTRVLRAAAGRCRGRGTSRRIR